MRHSRRAAGLLAVGLVAATISGGPAVAEIREDVVLRMKKSVVNVEKSVAHALNVEDTGSFHGTGFVVDAQRGIVATNRHVAGTSPAQTHITFENGESAEARILHYDVFHDFAFYRVDVSELDFPLRQVELGDSFALEEQDEVFMVGNNDVEEYSVKFGRVTNLVVDKGDRHSATFQTSFDRAGGSSGSPVMDRDGRVVGIHFKGSDTTSFEMRIEYLKDALEQLQASGRVRRGDVGLELELMRLSDSRKHFGLPDDVAEQIAALRPGLKRLIYVDYVVPGSPAFETVEAGDLVVEIDGKLPGNDLYAFDKAIDAKVGQEIELTIYRNGRKIVRRLPVADAEKSKVLRFALFAGGVMHDVTPELRRRYEISGPGTFLSQANPGSPFSELGYGTRSRRASRAVMIEQINGVPTPDLESFVRAARSLKNDDDINVTYLNLRARQSSPTVEWFTLDLRYSPLRVFEYDRQRLDWIEVED